MGQGIFFGRGGGRVHSAQGTTKYCIKYVKLAFKIKFET